jgi:NAD(P)-dependent dehydrogenase (short-subunit alcohol dehydrogenase family)
VDRLTPKGQMDKVNRIVPLQRQGEFGDVTNATIFLFSEAANWVTGQIFVRIVEPPGADFLLLNIRTMI